MTRRPTEQDLAKLYAQLMQRRRGTSVEPDVPVETIHALANGSYTGADRISLLERVLSDPNLAAEFQLFRDLANAGTAARRSLRPRVLALAAGIGVLAAAGLLWLLTQRGTTPEPLRGSDRAPLLIAPGAGASLAAGERLVWHAVSDAQEYRVELADSEGAVIFAETLRDTLATVPDSTRLLPEARYLWWVTATRSDGTSSRASPVAVRGRVP
jgi:hypothetical protein